MQAGWLNEVSSEGVCSECEGGRWLKGKVSEGQRSERGEVSTNRFLREWGFEGPFREEEGPRGKNVLRGRRCQRKRYPVEEGVSK